ncbi:archaellin/type IV pilin N-terminal domain-containing protein [Natrinema salsiterrestre]|uniref:Flagellin n=1 Tax=Natrinema salsiterrestre TaxID=2950540 RepID=A0A9Q4L3H7_9EURY|nr:archaellin/type IV pilin N-terminal domain-containing protein [Natrinema salsiterrestre]MDF9744656.1 flagellin [Natrinema salsiterrestre]
MFEAITERDERGQVGIGTLIVFIAMVLVAAIAAGVLINTAGLLQSQASSTGEDTQQEVANQISVVDAVGTTGSDGITEIRMTIKKSAGSNAIDLTSATVQYTSDTTSTTLVHDDDSASASAFTTEAVGVGGGTQDNSLTSSEQRVTLTIDVASIEGTSLATGSDATLSIVDQSGATTVYGVTVPNTFGNKDYVIV